MIPSQTPSFWLIKNDTLNLLKVWLHLTRVMFTLSTSLGKIESVINKWSGGEREDGRKEGRDKGRLEWICLIQLNIIKRFTIQPSLCLNDHLIIVQHVAYVYIYAFSWCFYLKLFTIEKIQANRYIKHWTIHIGLQYYIQHVVV